MATATNSSQPLVEELADGWNGFWFTPSSAVPLAGMRILTGALAFLFLFSFVFHLQDWFGPNGLLPPDATRAVGGGTESYRLSLLYYMPSTTELWVVQVAGMICAVVFTVGIYARITGPLTYIFVLSYIHRGPMISEQFEVILSFLLLYTSLGPCDRYWSIKRLGVLAKDATQPSWGANLAIRLIQVHLCGILFLTGAASLAGGIWWRGDAIWTLIAQTQAAPVDLTMMRDMPYIVNMWTFAILAMNFLFPVLIWRPRLRKVVQCYAIACWLSLMLVSGFVHYYLALIAASLAFLPAESWTKLLNRNSNNQAEATG